MTDKGRLLTDGTVEFASGNRQCILTQACPPPMINHLTSLKKLLVHVVYPWPSWQACASSMGIFFFFFLQGYSLHVCLEKGHLDLIHLLLTPSDFAG